MRTVDVSADGSRVVTEWDDTTGDGTRTFYNSEGVETGAEAVTGMPTATPTAEDRIAELEAIIAALVEAP